MTSDRVTLTVTDGIADVRLNRPDKLNAMDEIQFRAVADTIARIEARRDIRCVVLSGEGRAFCVGIDLQRLSSSPALRGLVREDRLRELVLTGRRVEASEAARIGLVTDVADDPRAAAMELARSIAGSSPDAVRAAKRLFNLPWQTCDADVLLEESREQERLLASDSHREAVCAGQEGRAPLYRD